MKRIEIPPGSAILIELTKGQKFRVTNSEGGQVVDTWAFKKEDVDQYLSMEHSRSAIYRLWFKPGDTLVSNLFQPMLTIVDDTSPGLHDTLHAACSVGSNDFYGAANRHPNCQDNLKAQMAERGFNLTHIPCPWNLFEHALVNDDSTLLDQPSTAQPGDYVELKTEMPIFLVCSACPSQVGGISGGIPRGAAIDLP